MKTIVFSVLIITLLYHSTAAYPYYQDARITEFRVKAPIAEGETALLSCKYDMGDDTFYGLQWLKDGQVFYRYIQMENRPRIYLIPSVNIDVSQITNQPTNSITLDYFTRESAGLYRCEVYADDGSKVYREKYVAPDPPRTCTTEDGYSGLCKSHNFCRPSSEYGAGVFDVRISQSETSCPVPLICCKGEEGEVQVYQHIEPFTYKNDAKTPAEVDPQAVSCTISGEQGDEAGECVPRHLCGEGRTIIEDGAGIIGPRTSTGNCPQSTVCCKIPDNNEPKESANSSRDQNGLSQTAQNETSQARDNSPETVTCTIIEEQGYVTGECVQSHLCGPGRTINEYGEGIIGPRAISDNCPQSTVCCKIPDNNEPKESANPSRDQNSLSQTAQNETSQARDNYPETVTCTILEEQGYVTGECVQSHLCGPGRTINEYGEGIIGPRAISDNCPQSTVCCKIPDNNEAKESANPSDNQNAIPPKTDNHPETMPCTIREGQWDVTGKCGNGRDNSASRVNNNSKNPANSNNYQNQLETPTAEIAKPQTLSCMTREGSSGECVQNYLCDTETNSEITDGEGIINARMEDDCPTPMVCCKVPDDNEHNNTASQGNNNNYSGNGIADGNNEKDPANPNIYQNQHKTPTEDVTKPQPLSCKARDGSSGECVQNYLCDRQTNFAITDGQDIIDARMEDDIGGCPLPMVCCKLPDKNEHEDFATPVKDNKEDPTNPSIYQYHTETLAQEAEQPQKTPESPDRLNFDALAISYSKQPSIYLGKQLPLSQAPIYPYIRVPRDISRSGCGWRNPNGVNVSGSDAPLHLEPNQAKPGEFPWTVGVMNFIRREGKTVKFEYLGSGALIHERVVLTAAHTFDRRDMSNPMTFYVTVGDYDQNGYKFLPRKAIQVEDVVIHENYNLDFNFNDFALVFLLKPALPSGHVNYICLPPPGHVDVDRTGVRCVTSGWGKDGHNQYQFVMSTAELPIVDHTTCQSQHRTIPELGPGFILDQSFMCAGENGVDSCKGSGGAPLACPMENVPDRYILSGLVSWSKNCSLDGRPSVFARVTSVRQWIDDKMDAHSYTITTD